MENQKKVSQQSGITVGYQCELMQNYVAESNVDFGKGLLTVKASEDHAYLFFIDKKSVLRVLVYSEETNSGWRAHCISPDGYEVTAFAAHENQAKGYFRLSYARRKDGISELLVAENIAVESIDNEKWELDYQWKFKNIERKERLIDHITMDERGLLYSANFTQTDANFYYFKYADEPVPYTLPENGNRVKQIRLGRVSGEFGVFLLYYVANRKTLLFRALRKDRFGEAPVHCRYTTGADVQSFDLLPDAVGNSTLYTAGEGIYRFVGERRNLEPIVVSDHELKFSKIDASQLKDEVSLWVLGKSGNRSGLFYVTNRTYDSSSKNSVVGKLWTKPLQMHADIEEFESVKGENLINQLYLYGKTKDSDDEGVIHFWQDKVSTQWQEQFLNVDDAENTIEIESYTIEFQFFAEGTEDLLNKKAAISSNENVAVYINNRRRFLLDGKAAEFELASNQKICLVYPVKSLQSGKIILSGDFLDADIEIEPASGVMSEIKNKLSSADSIKNAKTQTGNSLMNGDVKDKDLAAAAQAVRQMGAVAENLEKQKDFSPADIKSGEAAIPVLRGNIFSQTFNAVGDLYHAVEKGFETVTNFVVDTSKKICKVIIEIAGQVLDFIVDTAQKVVAFVERVFDKIKVFFKDLFDFLAFLFNWGDILETKEVLKKIGEKYLDNIKSQVTELKGAAVGYIMELREKYDRQGKIIGGENLPVGDFNSMMRQSAQQESVDSRINWVDSKKDVIFGNSAKAPGGAVTLEQVGEIKSSQEAKDIPAEILDLFIKLIRGDISFGDFMSKFVDLIIPFALEMAQKIVETIFDLAIKFLDVVKKVLYSPIEIPLLSGIYKKISKSDLSIADLIALIISIPAAIAYKIIHNKKMFGEVSGDAFIADLQFN